MRLHEKRLDKRFLFRYIYLALRRQQVASAVIPAEDINNILIVFVSLRLYAAGAFFLSVITSVEVKYTHAKRKGS